MNQKTLSVETNEYPEAVRRQSKNYHLKMKVVNKTPCKKYGKCHIHWRDHGIGINADVTHHSIGWDEVKARSDFPGFEQRRAIIKRSVGDLETVQ